MSRTTPPAFSEKDFELLASALDRVDATRRELFLAKLVILLTAGNPDPVALASCIARAEKHLETATTQ